MVKLLHMRRDRDYTHRIEEYGVPDDIQPCWWKEQSEIAFYVDKGEAYIAICEYYDWTTLEPGIYKLEKYDASI